MAWTIEYTATARKQLHKLDRQMAQRIDGFLAERIAKRADPREIGKQLSGPLGDLWRYRVGNYRILVDLQDERLVVQVLRIGHRRHIYR